MTKLNVNFNYNAWDEYLEWKKEDKKTSKKIDSLIKDCQRHPFTGKGKPEPLKANLSGAWSRQINHKNRMVYSVTATELQIWQLKYHYSK
ncbi:Txe/YoeB family addiction module toxin [Lactobacillus gallinarum]|uniref:Txe/YoeB family addiction module toxin n=1 Tax=Lactobacillus gallinarum TaxID=52242 RepID=UPI0024BBD3A4|nr:Txe/YoeB family addiction module toxin [Lactobacillus gallinarum]MDM8281550.1 Txe/YoeB family addiction module toxin [Lactobacillus gallinarum]